MKCFYPNFWYLEVIFMDDEDRKFVNKFLDEAKQINPRKVVDVKEADVIEVDRNYVKELMDTYLL